MRNFKLYLILLIVSVAVSACGGRKTVDNNIEVEPVGGTIQTDESVSTSGLGADSTVGAGLDGTIGQSANADPLSKRVIYFDYDSSVLTLEGEAIVQAHARYLNSVPGVGIILEGHADERGTREYNLALGEDRAKAVANIFQALGVSSNRIQTVSYGEERPVALSSDESAWSLNRRVEILY
ncbi:MAG: peptidoglycan-associated lipoprotein Pal [Gammaproteobacteria bacterium]|nr:peptidoglycan-associated lipoprotein Pal [Gammaproteobacteria bacterium]